MTKGPDPALTQQAPTSVHSAKMDQEVEKLKTFQKIYEDAKKNHPHLPPVCKDITEPRWEAWVRIPWLEDWATEHLIADPRDKIMVSTLAGIVAYLIPMHTLLWNYSSNWLGPLLLVPLYALFLQRFILLMHYAEHRKLFKSPLLWPVTTCLIAPFFGVPPGFYWMHHVVMHHVENNICPWDLSSTEEYRRDNPLHFLFYLLKYWSLMVRLPIYSFSRSGRNSYGVMMCGCLAFFALMTAFLWNTRPAYALWGWIVPTLITSLALMFGNFSQHIFVDPSIATMPQNLKSYEFNAALTYNCMNHFDNRATFNDGYHIVHHLNSRCHWTELPVHFFKNIDKYHAAGAILFDDLHFFDVGICVFFGMWNKLAKHFVHLGREKKSDAEVIQMLKRRLVPIYRNKAKAAKAA